MSLWRVAVARDGRFLINQSVNEATATQMMLQMTWNPAAKKWRAAGQVLTGRLVATNRELQPSVNTAALPVSNAQADRSEPVLRSSSLAHQLSESFRGSDTGHGRQRVL